MDSKTKKIFVSCSFGAMAGLVVSMMVPQIIWWLGALVGGFISGATFAFRDIALYAPIAAKYSWQKLSYLPRIWQAVVSWYEAAKKAPLLKKWEWAVLITALFSVALIAVCVVILSLFIAPAQNSFYGLVLLPIFLVVWVVLQLFQVVATMLTCFDDARKGGDEKRSIAKYKWALLLVTPIGFPLFLVFGIASLAAATPKAMFDIFRFLAIFVKKLYFFIRSKEVLLCAMDGALAVAISYLFFVRMANLPMGLALAGAGLVGGLLGMFDYEIMSKRLFARATSKKAENGNYGN